MSPQYTCQHVPLLNGQDMCFSHIGAWVFPFENQYGSLPFFKSGDGPRTLNSFVCSKEKTFKFSRLKYKEK